MKKIHINCRKENTGWGMFWSFLILPISIVLGLSACKKTAVSHSPYDSKFSFTYNGTHYVLPYKDGTAEWAILDNGISINRPDIFNGIIYFPYAGCAYFEPTGTSIQSNSNCQLSALGFPIDSVAVYLYQSGSVNISYSNCQHHSEYDVVTGTTVEYDVCDANGSFDLVLKNKEGKTITITDGELQEYSLQR